MKIFVGWSGERSRIVGYRLTEWLKSIVPGIEIFYSPNIPGGSMWLNTLTKELHGAKFGILCITKENQNSSWINFEAGALWKGIGEDALVCPLLIDTELDSKIPIEMFQAKRFDENGVKQLCRFLAEKTNLEARQVDLNFKGIWPNIIRDVENDLKILNDNLLFGIKILSPEPDTIVSSPIKVSGTYQIKPPVDSIRILEYDPISHQYWPKGIVIFNENNKTWETEVNIGTQAKKRRVLYIAQIGKDGEALLDYRSRAYNETNKMLGIQKLTSDIIFCNQVNIIIQPVIDPI